MKEWNNETIKNNETMKQWDNETILRMYAWCIYGCMSVFLYVWMYVWFCMYVFGLCMYVHMHYKTHRHTPIDSYRYRHTWYVEHMLHTERHRWIHTYIPSLHTNNIHIHTSIHPYVQIHTSIQHTYIQTYIHRYIMHTYVRLMQTNTAK